MEPRLHDGAGFPVDIEERAAFHAHIALKNIEHLFLVPIFLQKDAIELAGSAHLKRLGGHHRPGKNGHDGQYKKNELGFERGLLPNINQVRFCV